MRATPTGALRRPDSLVTGALSHGYETASALATSGAFASRTHGGCGLRRRSSLYLRERAGCKRVGLGWGA
eukprot:1221295-Prymnesium_polylepis.1